MCNGISERDGWAEYIQDVDGGEQRGGRLPRRLQFPDSINCKRLDHTPDKVNLEMTRAQRVRSAIIAVAVLVIVTACVLLLAHRSQARLISVVFEEYGTLWDYPGEEVAFLQFTNASDKTYGLPMTGGTNTLLRDSPLGSSSASYLVDCEFSDQPILVPRASIASWGLCVAVAPHSAVRLRVALPPKGRTRRVAVLCAEQPSGSPRRFWTNGIGLSIFRMLPRSVGRKLLFSQPAVERVWCDRELSPAGERLAE